MIESTPSLIGGCPTDQTGWITDQLGRLISLFFVFGLHPEVSLPHLLDWIAPGAAVGCIPLDGSLTQFHFSKSETGWSRERSHHGTVLCVLSKVAFVRLWYF